MRTNLHHWKSFAPNRKRQARPEHARSDWVRARAAWAQQQEIDLSAASEAPLPVLLREDFNTHYRSWVHPGLHALWVYRLGHWGYFQTGPARLLVKIVHRLLNRLIIQNVYGAEIDDDAVIGRRVLIGHQQGVQIPSLSVIGDECIIRHNVTLGLTDTACRANVPSIGRRVQLGTGASLLGKIHVGDDAKIGPHALVMKDVPAGATAFSPTARVMKMD
jgi:serine O-acetyltransferase